MSYLARQHADDGVDRGLGQEHVRPRRERERERRLGEGEEGGGGKACYCWHQACPQSPPTDRVRLCGCVGYGTEFGSARGAQLCRLCRPVSRRMFDGDAADDDFEGRFVYFYLARPLCVFCLLTCYIDTARSKACVRVGYRYFLFCVWPCVRTLSRGATEFVSCSGYVESLPLCVSNSTLVFVFAGIDGWLIPRE